MTRYSKFGTRGVLCLEGAWNEDLRDRSSVLPLLQMLEARRCCSYIHRDVGTVDEFKHYVSEWSSRRSYDHYEILYIATHGNSGTLELGGEDVDLEQLGSMLEGKCDGKIVYLGSCSTVRASRDRLEHLRRQTRARYILGYTKDVDWISTAAFELVLLQALTSYERAGAALNYLQTKEPRSLVAGLGFTRVPAKDSN